MAIGADAIWKLCDVLGVGKREQRSATMRATVTDVQLDGTVWVTLSGSTQLTPISQSLVQVAAGDEVNVTISGGRATITGSTSNQALGSRQVTERVKPAFDVASRALVSADIASVAASNAEQESQRATKAANAAEESAAAAAQEASRALSSAEEASAAAATAATEASAAQASAEEARVEARRANTHANDALTQLSVVEDVAGTLQWISEHGEYFPTDDTTVVDGRVYFELVNDEYVPVVEPDGSPSEQGWYVLDVKSSQSQYVMRHLAVTADGLWVLPNGREHRLATDDSVRDGTRYYELTDSGEYVEVTPQGDESPSEQGWYVMPEPVGSIGYKVLLANDGMRVYDDSGHLVSTHGESITFDSSRPQRIGSDDASIVFYDSDGDGQPDSIAIAGNVVFSSVEAIDSMLAGIAKNSADLSDKVAELQEGIEDARKEATNYLRIDPSLGIVLAQIGSQISNVLSNESMRFMTDSGEDVAHIGRTDDDVWEMGIATARIESQLRFNDFAWIRRDNGNMTLKWLGTGE